jgi:hypothetical protein
MSIHKGHLPLDAALFPNISNDWTQLTIFAYNPDLALIGVNLEVDSEILQYLCERLDEGHFMDVLEDTIRLIRNIQIF